jgi:hypothetical protein
MVGHTIVVYCLVVLLAGVACYLLLDSTLSTLDATDVAVIAVEGCTVQMQVTQARSSQKSSQGRQKQKES